MKLALCCHVGYEQPISSFEYAAAKAQRIGPFAGTVLRRAGLPIGLFKLDRILVSTEEFFALHRGIAEASNDPAIGLKLGTEERVERYDPVKLAALSARSFRDAVERTSRYKQLTCPEEIRIVERGNECASNSSGCSRMSRSRRCWWTFVLHGSSALAQRGTGRPATSARESSFNGLLRTEKCTKRISAAQ